MNPFKPQDIVYCKYKNKYNGEVQFTFCGECTFCKSKKYKNCTAAENDRVKVMVIWNKSDPKPSKFKYLYSDLDYMHNLHKNINNKSINGLISNSKAFKVDIRKLGVKLLETSLIEDEGDPEFIPVLEEPMPQKEIPKSDFSSDQQKYAEELKEYEEWYLQGLGEA